MSCQTITRTAAHHHAAAHRRCVHVHRRASPETRSQSAHARPRAPGRVRGARSVKPAGDAARERGPYLASPQSRLLTPARVQHTASRTKRQPHDHPAPTTRHHHAAPGAHTRRTLTAPRAPLHHTHPRRGTMELRFALCPILTTMGQNGGPSLVRIGRTKSRHLQRATSNSV